MFVLVEFFVGCVIIAMPRMSHCFGADTIISLWLQNPGVMIQNKVVIRRGPDHAPEVLRGGSGSHTLQKRQRGGPDHHAPHYYARSGWGFEDSRILRGGEALFRTSSP